MVDDVDAALDKVSESLREIQERIAEFYDLVVDAAESGATHTQLEETTGFSRGTVQNILKGHPVRIPPHDSTKVRLVAQWPGTYGQELSDAVNDQLESLPSAWIAP